MKLEGCRREPELKQALQAGQWPLACSHELQTHVNACRNCKELVMLSTGFQQARSQSIAAARVGTPGLIWWRAQIRRRHQAVDRVTKPLLGAQVFALAVMLLAVCGFFGYSLTQRQDPAGWLLSWPQTFSAHLAAFTPSAIDTGGWSWLMPMALLSALVLLGSVVVYFSSDRN